MDIIKSTTALQQSLSRDKIPNMSVDNQFASEFGHVPDPTQNDIQNTLFPTLES